MVKLGDIVSDCPTCNAIQAVTYVGRKEAKCGECNEVYDVDLEDEVEELPALEAVTISAPPPTQPLFVAPIAPPPEPKPVEDLTDEVTVAMEKMLEPQTKKLNLPAYLANSKAWRWAHSLKKNGNPYKSGSRSWVIFNMFEQPMTMLDGLRAFLLGQNEKLKAILTYYEVLTTCVAAGLLIHDKKTDMISICTATPVPSSLP